MFTIHWYRTFTFTFLLFTIIMWNEIDAAQKFYLRKDEANMRKVLSDMPLGNEDLMRYIRSLELVTAFSSKYHKDLDFQYFFALFLVNVQLRRISVPATRTSPLNLLYNPKIWNILVTNEMLLRNYRKRVENEKVQGDKNDDLGGRPMPNTLSTFEEAMLTFMENSTEWIERMDDLNFDLLARDDPSSHKDLLFEYPEWSDYLSALTDFDKFSPSPLTSDKCLLSLHTDEFIGQNNKPKQCNIVRECEEMVLSGNTFGYYLTHRFMYMVLAHLGRGCYIFSPERDMEMRNVLCAVMYVEASYIAANDFKLGDLMVEQMTLCGLDGHAQFLRRSWMNKIITFQSDTGCFYIESGLVNPNKRIAGCDLHTTALAAGALSAVIRYVVERTSEIKEPNETLYLHINTYMNS